MSRKRWAALLVGVAALVLWVVASLGGEQPYTRGQVGPYVGSFPPDYSSDRCYAAVDGGHTEVPCP
jgi:hypothetical protein